MAEVAGLALAIFPLLVKEISGYANATHMFQDVLRWRRGMNSLLRELKAENVLFQNTCASMLNGTFEAEQAVELLRGVGWDDSFKTHLHDCWGEKNASVFIDGMEAMGVILREFEQDLGILDGVLPVDKDKYSRKMKWSQIEAVLRRDDRLAGIKSTNGQLERVAMQLPASIRKFSKLSTATTEDIQARELAINLHAVFKQKLQDTSSYPCNAPHNATLRLPRVRGLAKEKGLMPIRFEVLFLFNVKSSDASTSWRGLDFEPLETSDSESMALQASSNAVGLYPTENSTPEKPRGTGRRLISSMATILCARTSASQTKVPGIALSPSLTATSRSGKHRNSVRYNIPDEAKSITATIKPTIPSGGKEKAIENLCSVIQQAVHQSFNGSSASAISLGALLGERNVAWNCLRPRTVIAFPFEKIRAIPLDAVLKTGGLHPVEALKLGVQIALALMQLHTTQWLGNTWGKKDIFILHREVEREQVVSGTRTIV